MGDLLKTGIQETLQQHTNQTKEQSEETTVNRLSFNNSPVMNNNKEVHKNERNAEINIPRTQYRELDMSAFKAESRRNIDSKMHKIEYKIVGASFYDNPYGNFKDRVDDKKRRKAINNKRSRLYQKHKNAKLLEKIFQSTEESRESLYEEVMSNFTWQDKRILDKNVNIKDYITLIGSNKPETVAAALKDNLTNEDKEEEFIETLIDNFLEAEINMDLSSDKIIAENAADYEKQRERYKAYKSLLPKINNPKCHIKGKKIALFNRKLEDVGKLIGYYDIKCRLMTNDYYKDHYNDELGSYYGERAKEDDADKQKKEVSALIMEELAWKYIIDGENEVFSDTLNEIKNTEEKKACILATSMIAYQVGNVNMFYHERLLHSKSIFSRLLKFVSRFKRESYTDLHGRKKYKESIEKIKFIPDKLQKLNDKDAQPLLYKHFDNTPEIDITKFYKDSYKSELKDIYAKILNLNIKDKNPTEYEKLKEAIDAYLKTNGIVNKDTVEMEMAFLDQFLVSSKTWLESNESFRDTEDYQNIKALRDRIVTYSQGSLKANMEDADFEFVKKHAITVREHIGQHNGGPASNIKDIPLFLHQPNINDIKQSSIGNCWFMSAVTSIVKISPEYIRSMFQDLDDGRVIVRLYDIKNKDGFRDHDLSKLKPDKQEFSPVYVILDKQYETGLGNAADCPWLQLLERAYAACGFNHDIASFEKTKNGTKKMHNMIDEMTDGEIYLGISHMIGKNVTSRGISITKRAQRPNDMDDPGMFEATNASTLYKYNNKAGIDISELNSNVEYKNYSDSSLAFFKQIKAYTDNGDVVPCAMGAHGMDILDTKVYNGRLMFLMRDPFNIYHNKYTDNIYKKPDSAGLGTVILKYLGYRTLSKDRNRDGNIHRGFLGTSWWDLDDVLKEINEIVPLTRDMIENR